MSRIALADMIEELRHELKTAIARGDGQDLRFEVGEITLEAEVEVAREAGAQGGIKFWLVELGASGSASRATTQKLTLKLRPVGASGEDQLLSRDLGDRPLGR